eukprot:m.219874 g.219874  ORF g.219874 m.219874 type:complete len:90 (+) comp10269_c0_seq1:204-473(+)
MAKKNTKVEKKEKAEESVEEEEEEEASPPPKGKKGAAKTAKAEKTKRAPSAYNIFIKDKLAELKASNPEMDHKQRFKAATEAWNEQKKA